jgi:DNA-binding MarR family transcriptional regulator
MKFETIEKDIEGMRTVLSDSSIETMKIMGPFYMLHRRVYEGMSSYAKNNFPVSNSDIDLLMTLENARDTDHTLSPTELYERLLFSSGGMTKMLKRLEEKGYIRRLDNSKDRRSKLVQLTPEGREAGLEALKAVLAYEENYLKGLDKEEREIFQKLLMKLLSVTS